MSEQTRPNHGAFACMTDADSQIGLTKREYFAAVALQGLLSQHVNRGSLETVPVYGDPFAIDNFEQTQGFDALAQDAVVIADELIEELNDTRS
jgi:hypothetical protein